jgi:hypothetical protein
MRTKTTTLIAAAVLLFAGNVLMAQTTVDPAIPAALANSSYDWTSAEAAAIDAALADKETLSYHEAIFRWRFANEGDSHKSRYSLPENATLLNELASKNEVFAGRKKAFVDEDPVGWTTEQIRLDSAPWQLANSLGVSHPFYAQVVNAVNGTGNVSPLFQKMFKTYRATLPKAQQVAMTQKEKDGLIAVATRNPAQDVWLTEVSADLMALQLD